jgi:hypothetical protein
MRVVPIKDYRYMVLGVTWVLSAAPSILLPTVGNQGPGGIYKEENNYGNQFC